MKIYMLGTVGGLFDDTFAACRMGSTDGTTYMHQNHLHWWRWGNACPHCRMNAMVRIVPWQLEWYEGSDRIGDFAGYTVPCWEMLAQKKVIDFFRHNDYFVNVFETVFKAVPPPTPRSRKPRYPIVSTTPYEGPPFWGFSPQYGVHMNDEKSHKTRLSSCSVCGNVEYVTKYDAMDESKCEYPWKDFVIDEEEWNGLKLFGVFELDNLLKPGNGVFLSEEGYDLLMKQGFTNVKCVEVGRIEKAGHGNMKPYRAQADYDFWKPDEYVPQPPKTKPKRRTVK